MSDYTDEQLDKTYNQLEAFSNSVEKQIPIDEFGDLALKWFTDKYWALRTLNLLPTFDAMYQKLINGSHTTEKSCFNAHSSKLWVIPHKTAQVIVEAGQNYKAVYIKDTSEFHIRWVEYKMSYPETTKAYVKGCTLKGLEENDFKPKYGDPRDKGYILSLNKTSLIFAKTAKVESCGRTKVGIQDIEIWKNYINEETE